MKKKKKVDISNRYFEEEEANRPKEPYKAFYNTLKTVFYMNEVDSVVDVGCACGYLLSAIKENHKNIEIMGIEYFDYHLKYVDQNIKNCIKICDLRDPLNAKSGVKKNKLVICTEVGEHIEKEYASTLLNNLKYLLQDNGFVVMSWSPHGGENQRSCDPHHQHLNPLNSEEFSNLMIENGFIKDIEHSNRLLTSSYDFPQFYGWWRESLSVWRVKKIYNRRIL